MNAREYRFRIDGCTPDTLSMERLAEYMADLSQVFGEPESVHFVRLEGGSAILVQKIDEKTEPKVRARARASRTGEGPAEAVNAYRRLNRRLLDHDATGVLDDDTGTNVLVFPGREQAEPVTFGSFNQESFLDGVVIRVGGVRDPVPVTLESANQRHMRCLADREMAKVLAQYLFGPEIRVHGNGRWSRDKLGAWTLERFVAGRFEVLGGEPLSAVLARLRDIPGSEWPDSPDPWGELHKQRNASGEQH